jgi:hypothetical protein
MASRAPALLTAAGPLARAAAGAVRMSSGRSAALGSAVWGSAAAAALRRLEGSPSGRAQRHPLTPAAVRVERARSHRHGERSDQTAVTVWFGEGPALPGPGGGDALRSAMRISSGVVGAAALAALTAIAARREEARTRVIDAPARRRGSADHADSLTVAQIR